MPQICPAPAADCIASQSPPRSRKPSHDAQENVSGSQATDLRKAQEALRIFQEIASKAPSATDLHNDFFGNFGHFGQLFPTREEREEFLKTPEYEEMVRVRVEMRKKEKAAPSLS